MVEPQGATLQEKVDSLKFQILLKQKDIQYYSSKNVTLEKQNVGLKQEVRKVESEINKKNSAIYALKEQIKYFKEQTSQCDNLKKEIAQLKSTIEDLKPIQILLHGPMNDASRLVGKNKDPEVLIRYIGVMKKELIERFDKCKQLRMSVKKLQEELSKISTKSGTSLDEQTKQMDLEEKLVISESKNMALQKRIDELEEILDINEKSNSLLEVQKTTNKDNILEESSMEQISKKDNQHKSSRDLTLSDEPKRKKKTSVRTVKSVREKMNDFDIENNTLDSDISFVNESSSTNSPIASKRFKLSEDDTSGSDESDNDRFSNSSISKKKRNIKMKKKRSETGNRHSSHVIDLT